MQKFIGIGNLVRDPEYTTTNSGVALCRFTIAIGRKYTNASGEKETDYLNIVTWKGLADNCNKFLKKGKKVAVVGTVQTRSYEAQDGGKRYATDIVAEQVDFLTQVEKQETKATISKLDPSMLEDLPF